jgi:hypothetical protein
VAQGDKLSDEIGMLASKQIKLADDFSMSVFRGRGTMRGTSGLRTRSPTRDGIAARVRSALQPRWARPGGTALAPATACSYDLAGGPRSPRIEGSMTGRVVRVERSIPAAPSDVWAVLADLPRLGCLRLIVRVLYWRELEALPEYPTAGPAGAPGSIFLGRLMYGSRRPIHRSEGN